MTQRELATEFQVTCGAVAQWEGGQKTIPGPVLRLISLYERDLAQALPPRPSPWIDRTTNLTILGGTLMAQAMFASAPPSSIRARLRDRIFEKYVDVASRRRGLTMKWAQFVWGLEPVLSSEQREALRAFQSLGPIMTAPVAARVFFEEFGTTPREAFAQWSPTAFASASLGQVHRARLKTGEQVAVKIQHPDAATRMDADLEQLRLLERIALVFMRNQKPGVIHEELRTIYSNECDYRIEAKHHQWMCRTFGGDPHIRVPELSERFTSRRVITTRYVSGTPLETFARRASQAERDAAGDTLWRFSFQTILDHGTYNADQNPGNHLFAPGQVTFLDFGRVKRVSAEFHAFWKRWLRAVLERNEDDAKRAMVGRSVTLRTHRRSTSVTDLRCFGLGRGRASLIDRSRSRRLSFVISGTSMPGTRPAAASTCIRTWRSFRI
jgi:predicted unusual protein kinase regulating ubiquinone biosynthesis (AarF/ABC1/UbiB family)